jgi:hypothetical protein
LGLSGPLRLSTPQVGLFEEDASDESEPGEGGPQAGIG